MRTSGMLQRIPPDTPLGTTRTFGADRFAALWQRCVASPSSPDAANVYARIMQELAGPARHFHNIDHIRECVERVDEVACFLDDRDAVELALWFHDAILDPGASDNERRSAALFLGLATGATPPFRYRVARLILATRHSARTQRRDRAFIVDIDLAGLGAPWDEFMRKGALLRSEMATQTDDEYYQSQVVFLQRQLARPWLFATHYFRNEYEATARANLQRLLTLRASQGYSAA